MEDRSSSPLAVHMRIFEILAKLPYQHSMFGVREGEAIKNRILSEAHEWSNNRNSKVIDLNDEVYAIFERVFKSSIKLQQHKPVKVKYKRKQTFS